VKRRAILHIGTEKTGTSTLQAFLAHNRWALRKKGFCYPRFPGRQAHNALPVYAKRIERADDLNRWLGVATEWDLARFRRTLRRTARLELLTTRAHTFIFSSEHLQSRLFHPDELQALKDFLDAFFSDVQVCVYLRRQDRVAVSRYSTDVKSGRTARTLLPSDPKTLSIYDYKRLLDRWAEVFGEDRLHPRICEPGDLIDGNIQADFQGVWQLGDGLQQVPNRNESLKPEAQEFLRVLNMRIPSVVDGHPNEMRYPVLRALREHFSGPGLRPKRSDAEAFFARFEASNEAVRQRFFPERQTLFDDDFDQYPENPQHQFGFGDAMAVATKVIESMYESRRWSG
jgi:hypothetical protein